MSNTRAEVWFPHRVWLQHPRLRLFCFPYAGGGPAIFRAWQEHLPPGVEVFPAQLPGLGQRLRESPFRRMSPLIKALAQAVAPFITEPFALFGHSMGGLVAFELARALREQYDAHPMYLFVSGCRAPQLPSIEAPSHDLPEPALIAELRALQGTEEILLQNAELMRWILPRLRVDLEVCDTYTYTPKPPLDCPISAFGGLQDDRVSAAALDAWREHTRLTFRRTLFAGDHFFLKTAQPALLQAISDDLALALAQNSVLK